MFVDACKERIKKWPEGKEFIDKHTGKDIEDLTKEIAELKSKFDEVIDKDPNTKAKDKSFKDKLWDAFKKVLTVRYFRWNYCCRS